ncbi:cytochrome c1 [Tropicimonas sp. IMCC6043]|uniref:cytochrome c1 n=1 Tax=Tropicimonas sp. IMCC6043 TaxID=2510645 RepID=UPI00101D134B|nr:cytochrome c1 [Tropicimonas sp. IMCC6043]RYH09950.1 cytochrome c1 [Tropicimonas sp. IMCC6043]
MIKQFALTAAAALVLSGGVASAAGDTELRPAESHGTHDVAFSFEGPFGTYDQMQLQRGLQVYTEVCSSCHGMQYVPIRTLSSESGPGLPEDQVRAYAEQFLVTDELSNPQLFDRESEEYRALTPNDHFPANHSQGAPDLSLMAKARAGFHGPYGTGISQFFNGIGGPEYIVSLLTGYTGEEKEEAGTIFYENTAFPGGWISMAPPLYGEDVEFADGHPNSLHHEAVDVAAFLMWAAEPQMMARKKTGFIAVIFLTVLTVLLYATNKRLWKPVKKAAKEA